MPSEPRIPTEPTLEELSAYLDHELDDDARARVAQHVAGCADCQARLDGLRETAFAIRALPMETPPRTFTLPAKRRETFRWVPAAGWIGGLAAATLIIVVGVQHLPLSPAGMSTAAPAHPVSGGLGQGGVPYAQGAPYREVAPLQQTTQNDSSFRGFSTNSKTVAGAQGSSSSLTISTDSASYPASGVITLHVTTKGLSSAEASSVRIFVMRDGQGGYAVRLMPPSNAPAYPFDYQASYSIPQMQLPAPVAGKYSLQVTIDTSDHSGLVAWLPLTITP
jgi:Putative zinc-finger